MGKRTARVFRWLTLAWGTVIFVGAGFRVLADCSSFGLPFTDLGSVSGFCAAIAEAYYTGITNGTSATTFSPNANVTRVQAAAFATRTLDAALTRGSRRAALGQWWNSAPHFDQGFGLTTVGSHPELLQSDGTDVWVANTVSGTVSRVSESDGRLLDTWTGATDATGVLVAMGRVFVTGSNIDTNNLYMIDPSQTAGTVTTVTTGVGNGPWGIVFDGNNIWTANTGGSVSIITPGTWSVTTVTTGFSHPIGILFDGTNAWVTDQGDDTLKKLNADGSIAQSVTVGSSPRFPVFDGHNVWVPNCFDSSLTVVRGSDGAVLKTFSAGNGNQNGLNLPIMAAFDGQRVLVTNINNGGGVSLFKATDLSPIGAFTTPGVSGPFGSCSDAVNFWVSFAGSGEIGRF